MSALGFLRQVFSAPSRSIEGALPATLEAGPLPEEPVCLLGDPHGCAVLLRRFMTLRRRHFPEHRLIVLGDMIDRGDESAEVLRILRDACAEGAVCLRGNHEEMLLEFLDDPIETGQRWLDHGGLATLASYGCRGIPSGAAERVAMRDALRERMGAETEAWIRSLPLSWRSGDLVAAHAALDPSLPPERQEASTLVWGYAAFTQASRVDGLYVAHGHNVVERAHMRNGRLALDTGAYATGRLSYALIDPRAFEPERITLGVVPM